MGLSILSLHEIWRSTAHSPTRRLLLTRIRHQSLLIRSDGASQDSNCGRGTSSALAAGGALPRRRRRARIQYVSISLRYAHDGRTTYCWRIPAAYTVKQPQWTNSVLSGADKGCPISMELNLAATEVTAGDFVAVNWTVRLQKDRFVNSSNAVRQGAIFRVVDASSKSLVDVVQSNVHSCEFDSNCDPFRQGDRFVDNTPNKVGNFSKDGVLVFTSSQELRYPNPGVYSVLAHIILPSSSNATNERFDYAVYARLTVKEAATKAPAATTSSSTQAAATPSPASAGVLSAPSDSGTADDSRAASSKPESGSKFSTGLVVGIVLGAVAVIAFVLMVAFVLRKRSAQKQGSPALSPVYGQHLTPLCRVEKSTSNDGISSDASLQMVGRQRLGAAPRAGSAPAAVPYSGYLTSAKLHSAAVRGAEMDVREFDNTVGDDALHDTSYPFVAYGRSSSAQRQSPQQMVNSAYSVDFIYGDVNQSDERLLRQMRGSENSYDELDLDTNDSYILDGETIRSGRVFSSASEASASSASGRYEEFGERFSDVSDPHNAEI